MNGIHIFQNLKKMARPIPTMMSYRIYYRIFESTFRICQLVVLSIEVPGEVCILSFLDQQLYN